MSDLTLYVAQEDTTFLKIQLVLALLNKTVAVERVESQADLEKLDVSAKAVALKTPGGFISRGVAILRYLAETSNKSSLLGGDEEIDRAQVDQWLDFSWQDLGKSDAIVSFHSHHNLTILRLQESR